jgi:hypothetical protein
VHTSLDSFEGGDADAFGGVQYPDLDAIICHAVASGLSLESTKSVEVNSNLIANTSQQQIKKVIDQIVSPVSVWKRTHGTIGSSISREDIGLKPINKLAQLL